MAGTTPAMALFCTSVTTRGVEDLCRTAARDTDARERLWQAVQIVAKVRDHLTGVVTGGKLARRELDDLAGRRKYFGIV